MSHTTHRWNQHGHEMVWVENSCLFTVSGKRLEMDIILTYWKQWYPRWLRWENFCSSIQEGNRIQNMKCIWRSVFRFFIIPLVIVDEAILTMSCLLYWCLDLMNIVVCFWLLQLRILLSPFGVSIWQLNARVLSVFIISRIIYIISGCIVYQRVDLVDYYVVHYSTWYCVWDHVVSVLFLTK